MTDQRHLVLLDKTYKASNFHGVKFLGKISQRYIEIYPNEAIAACFLAEGVMYEVRDSNKVQLLPCPAVNEQGKVIQVNLTDIPFIPKERLLKDMKTVLEKFGTILDIGLHYEQSMGWCMGSGYAIIQQLTGHTYAQLSHTISWCSDNEDKFCHATFPEMPTWCRYCHEEGHTKFECKKALVYIMCYNCDRHGHKQADCDKPKRKTPTNQPFKKPRKTPSQSSEEAKKSNRAPGGSNDQATKQFSAVRGIVDIKFLSWE